MNPNLPARTLYQFVRSDFETAWDAVVGLHDKNKSGCNFMFGRQAMVLLELICRVCAVRESGNALDRFARNLQKSEPRYFTELPGEAKLPKGFDLPSPAGCRPERQLLSMLYDLLRHGLAHQHQQIPAQLTDGNHFGITLTGAYGAKTMDEISGSTYRPAEHLSRRTHNNDLWVTVMPEYLFFDLRMAAEHASVFSGGVDPDFFERRYDFTATEADAALAAAGHSSHD